VTRPATIVGALKVTRDTDLMRRQLETSRGILAESKRMLRTLCLVSVVLLSAGPGLRRRNVMSSDACYFVFTGIALYTVLTVPPGNHVAAPSGTDDV
jgi:hypothetical protein